MKKALMRLALLAWALFCLAEIGWSQTPKLNIVYPAVTGVMTALWTAAETKAFQKYGLDVDLLYVPSAPQVVRVMLAGDSQITVTGGAPVVSAHLKARSANPNGFIDMSLIKKLEEGGFFRQISQR